MYFTMGRPDAPGGVTHVKVGRTEPVAVEIELT
jgi:hypothetical protein